MWVSLAYRHVYLIVDLICATTRVVLRSIFMPSVGSVLRARIQG